MLLNTTKYLVKYYSYLGKDCRVGSSAISAIGLAPRLSCPRILFLVLGPCPWIERKDTTACTECNPWWGLWRCVDGAQLSPSMYVVNHHQISLTSLKLGVSSDVESSAPLGPCCGCNVRCQSRVCPQTELPAAQPNCPTRRSQLTREKGQNDSNPLTRSLPVGLIAFQPNLTRLADLLVFFFFTWMHLTLTSADTLPYLGLTSGRMAPRAKACAKAR